MSSWQVLSLIFVGAGVGGVSRYLLAAPLDGGAAAARVGLPLGTLLVNVLGSFLIGVAIARLQDDSAKALLIIGLLGGFTTFSAFSLQTIQLLQQQAYGLAGLHVALAVGLCLAGTALGLQLASSP